MDILTQNIDKIHTTELGIERIKRNLNIETDDVVHWCKQKIGQANEIIRKGKNWYVYADDLIITVNAHSYTIITAHKIKKIIFQKYVHFFDSVRSIDPDRSSRPDLSGCEAADSVDKKCKKTALPF
jgi:hypothetical protein